MKPANKELIEGIAELFDGYEEEYVPGEWEAFSQSQKATSRIFPMWMRIAAILLIMISVLPYGLNDVLHLRKNESFVVRTPVTKSVPLNVPAAIPSLAPIPDAAIKNPHAGTTPPVNPAVERIAANNNPAANNPAAIIVSGNNSKNEGRANSNNYRNNSINSIFNSKNNSVAVTDQHPAAIISDPVLSREVPSSEYAGAPNSSVVKGKTVQPDTAAPLRKQNTIDFLLSESKASQLAAHTVKKDKSGKWGFGVEIMPTLMKSNLNVGAGISTDYRLSEKFSLSSGISILQLDAGSSVSKGTNTKSAVSTLSSKQLTATDANLSAIDIPVGLVYHVNKNFYASAGVSYFNVIREKRSNTYETTTEFYRSDVDAVTGKTALYQAVKSESVAEPAQESPLKGNSYLGFFNFSLGREQHLSGRYTIIIEPFVKIPVGKLSDQELKLMNSGLKFKLAF